MRLLVTSALLSVGLLAPVPGLTDPMFVRGHAILGRTGSPARYSSSRLPSEFTDSPKVGRENGEFIEADAIHVSPSIATQLVSQKYNVRFRWNRFVYVPRAAGLRLAHEMVGDVPIVWPARPVVWVDAGTGSVLFALDRATHGVPQVRAFRENPFKTPKTELFDLPSLEGSLTLQTLRWSVQSCVDRATVRSVDWLGDRLSLHTCDIERLSLPVGGDFIPDPPVDRSDVGDAFAETTTAFHIDETLGFFAQRGFTALHAAATPLQVVVNARLPAGFSRGDLTAMACATCPLEPYDNAFFAPASDPWRETLGLPGDVLVFGQGRQRDWSYDGDVVSHELTHAVVESTAKLVFHLRADSHGAYHSAATINEAVADYFSSARMNDPNFAEYIGGGSPIRRLDNTDSCPNHLSNLPHPDSTMFSGALWSVRKDLDDVGKLELDKGVVAGLSMMGRGDPTLEEAAAAFTRGVRETSGEALGAKVAAAFAARRLDSCDRIVEIGTPQPVDAGYVSYGTDLGGTDWANGVVPSGVMFHKRVPKGATVAVLRFTARSLGLSPAWKPKSTWQGVVLVKHNAPITWTSTGSGMSPDMDRTIEVPPTPDLKSFRLELPVGTEDITVMIGARGVGDGSYDNVAMTFEDGASPSEPTHPVAARPIGGCSSANHIAEIPKLVPYGFGLLCLLLLRAKRPAKDQQVAPPQGAGIWAKRSS